VVVEPGAKAVAIRPTVAEQVGLQLAGVKAKLVTPTGNPMILNVKGAVITDKTVAVVVSTTLGPPAAIVRICGVAARSKSKAQAQTTTLKVAVLVNPPPTACTIKVVVPGGAVGEAVRVTAEEQFGLQVAGVNALAATPVGSGLEMLSVTGVVTPAASVAVTVSTPPGPPPAIVSVAGAAARLKSEVQAQTTMLKVAVLVTLPPTACTVKAVVPGGAVVDAVKVTVAEQVGPQLTGVNAPAVIPVGSGVVMLKVTGVVTPVMSVAVAVSTPLAPPGTIIRVAGVVARLKSKTPACAITRVKAAVRVTPPPSACIVSTVDELGAVADAPSVTVEVHGGLQLADTKARAVTPVGSAVVMLNVTGVVTPATNVAMAASEPPPLPVTIVKVAGEATRLKSKVHWPWPWVVTVKVTELVAEPLVPVTVTVSFPQKEPVLTVRVDVRLLPATRITLDGLREVVKLGVDVVADTSTVPKKPLMLATVTVAFIEEPGVMVAEAGLALRPKPGTGEPTRVIVFTIRSVL